MLWRCVADRLVAGLHVTRQIVPVISLLVAKRTYQTDVREKRDVNPPTSGDRMHTETGSGSVYSSRYDRTLPSTTRSDAHVAQYFATIQQATV